MIIFLAGIFALVAIAIILVVDDKMDRKYRYFEENATSYMLINIEPVYKTKRVNTGHSVGYTHDDFVFMDHYSDVNVFDGYKYHFKVYFKDGNIKHVTTREGSKLYSIIISKPQICTSRREDSFYQSFYF